MSNSLQHAQTELTTGVFDGKTDPLALIGEWMIEAEASEPNDPNAMALATVDEDGMPDVRMVLLKGFDETGFVFYTNLGSTKAQELAANAKAALCIHWKSLRRQIRVRGNVQPVSDAEADEYFATRHRLSRIGTWASKQSQPLESRFALEKAVAAQTARFGIGEIPRPHFWSGFRIAPVSIEFWSNGRFRLHDRLKFDRNDDGSWHSMHLYP